MKKLILINLVACTVFCLAFVNTKTEKASIPSSNVQCSSGTNDLKLKNSTVINGAETDEQVYQFKAIYIKI